VQRQVGAVRQGSGLLDDPRTLQPVEVPVDATHSTRKRPGLLTSAFTWWRGEDLNLRPSGHERSPLLPAGPL
jgi:hypothetical protein